MMNGDYMKIELIKKLANAKYKFKIDNSEIILYEDVIIDNNLLYKKEIDNELFEKILKDNLYYDAYNKVLKYINIKMRSIYEVENYLNKLNIDDNDKNKIINKLKEINLLNDKVYASAFVSDKIHLSNDGPLKIKKELLGKKISEEIIDEELNNYDNSIFEEKVKKIITKKKNSKYSNYIFKQKLLSFFINLGYETELVLPIVDSIEVNTNDIVKKEYDLLYKKLSSKFNDKKLDYEIRNRLYKKGFNMEEINNIKESD